MRRRRIEFSVHTGVDQIAQDDACSRLQWIAIEQRYGERCKVTVENDELPARPQDSTGLGQRPFRVEEMGEDRVCDHEVETGLRLPGRRSISDRE